MNTRSERSATARVPDPRGASMKARARSSVRSTFSSAPLYTLYSRYLYSY
ncbi:MAG: hypothetical protein JNG85_15450 [Spirochaetaceae bacterium]|nr:hypothetical protein [Spirochaetaceae bacterium]